MSATELLDVHVLGGLELDSVAQGFNVLDVVVKEAPVRTLVVRTVCPGKYLVLVTGSEAAVEAGVRAGAAAAGGFLLGRLYLPNAHPRLWPAITGRSAGSGDDAVGILESFAILPAIAAADAAVKAAGVELVHLRWGDEMGGKASIKLLGPIHEVQAAMSAGEQVLRDRSSFCARVVVPRPDAAIASLVSEG